MWDVSGRFRPRLRLQQINRIMFQRKSLTSEEFLASSNKCRSPRHSRAACWLSSAWNLWGWRERGYIFVYLYIICILWNLWGWRPPPCSARPGRARRRGGSTRRDRPRCPPRTGVDQPSSRTWGLQEPTWVGECGTHGVGNEETQRRAKYQIIRLKHEKWVLEISKKLLCKKNKVLQRRNKWRKMGRGETLKMKC